MKFGINFQAIKPSAMIEIAQAAEAAGFESLWRPDHLLLPTEMSPLYPYSDTGRAPIAPDWAILEPFTVFSFLGAVTEKINFGTSVYVLPLRNPIVTAKALISADRLTNGRILFGIGVGWWKEEFEAVGEEYKTRGSRSDEYINVIRMLCSQKGEVSWDGKHVKFAESRFEPKSIQQPAPPFIIGGESEAALRRAALLGDGWKGLSYPPAKAKEYIDRIRQIKAENGREGEPFDVTLSIPADAPLDLMAEYESIGVTRLVTSPYKSSGGAKEGIEAFADRVIGKV